ncbi:type II toxin-antitoxin system RelE/ParE family toxin [Pseudoramibacter porci]|uniref:Type II toxin-antitoxin system RelE/ParE family toxin n=1 Tax=Pseudoramibacter porci TaxID=2606631 RepID=A0A7X2NF56_9FIRM|nr:type II toxin-antitoxin system RelE/ParE family toxin [Pseudoramibacter porci]MSS19472.1 type II toxin-antitoxin system RelE/ParE family toxin [Pseudoramibacter porci]
MKYKILKTDTADAQISRIVLHVAQHFGRRTALAKLDEIESSILKLGDHPDLGVRPRYPTLRRQGYRVLVLKKDLVFYKIDEPAQTVIIYAVVDQRQDYVDIIRGL